MNEFTLLQTTSALTIFLIIFILIILFYLIGNTLHNKIKAKNETIIERGEINGTLLGFLGLLLAFTFSMSNSRFDRRRELIIEEANNIGTAILRADLYPDSIRQILRFNFQEYVEARIGYYEVGMDLQSAKKYYIKADSISKQLWKIVTTDARVNNNVIRSGQMIPALNAMIDITTTRLSAGLATVPDSIIYFLLVLCICSSFLFGYENKYKTDWIIVLVFAIMLSFTVYNIIDLDRPRSGFINMDAQNQKIVELREMFK